MRKSALAIIGLVLLCLLAALGTATASAGTVTVDSTTDVSDGDTSSISALQANPGSDGVISLREAIYATNNTAGSDTVAFNIPTSDAGYEVSGITGTWTISLTGGLPALFPVFSGGTIISGTTQAVNQGDLNPNGPEIEISGASMSSGGCLRIQSSGNVIHGLVINNCPGHGIEIGGTSATTNTVSGNYIGTDASGSSDLGNGVAGVQVYLGAQNNTIGGPTPGERNIISGNHYGVRFYSQGTDGNTVCGNYIGTDAAGTQELGNSSDGVHIAGGAQDNTVGGQTAPERNVISGNYCGVYISDADTDGNTVSGNYIGSDVTGTQDMGNSYYGVRIRNGAASNTVGGQTAGERNVISGSRWGVDISDADTDGNTVSGNYIGTDVTGTQDMGNDRYGVRIQNGAENNTIGPDNLIAYNEDHGVYVDSAETMGNTITQNSIHSNDLLGIDLDSGSNGGIVAPTVIVADVRLILGTASPGDTVEVFTGPDEEGKDYLDTALADGAGQWSLSGPFTFDTYVTATATDDSGNTSEFSAQSVGGCCALFLPVTLKSY